VALDPLPKRTLDAGDIALMENLIPADRGVKGLSVPICAIFAQPFKEPAFRLAQFGGGFVEGQGADRRHDPKNP
jgi:hypothetical protein